MIAIYIFEEWFNDESIESDTLLIICNGKAVYEGGRLLTPQYFTH